MRVARAGVRDHDVPETVRRVAEDGGEFYDFTILLDFTIVGEEDRAQTSD